MRLGVFSTLFFQEHPELEVRLSTSAPILENIVFQAANVRVQSKREADMFCAET